MERRSLLCKQREVEDLLAFFCSFFFFFSLILNALKSEQVGLKTPPAYTADTACTAYNAYTAFYTADTAFTAFTVSTVYTVSIAFNA